MAQRPNHITGRQIFFKHIMEKLSQLNTTRAESEGISRHMAMAKHGAYWAALPDASRAAWERHAARERVAKAAHLSSMADEAEAALDVALVRESEQSKRSKRDPTMLVRNCRWDDAEGSQTAIGEI
eukprot:6461004-Amphidinium_carterae.2